MKSSYWGYWLILLGVFIVGVMMLSQNATTTDTQDYYQLKEVANGAIYDSIDYSYYTQTHQVRMIKELFVANFVKRFANTVPMTNTYKVDFYDLYESPPKASVKISTTSGTFVIAGGSSNLDIVNSIDLIVAFNNGQLASPEGGPILSGCPYYD